jgi:signal transduction histidine kinase
MKKIINKFIFTALVFFLLLNFKALADISYPFSIEYFDFFKGGKIYLSEENQEKIDSNSLFYFVKTSWVDDNEMIYFWNGLEQNNTKGKNIGNSYVIDANIFNNNLLLIVKKNNHIYLTHFDTSSTNIFDNFNEKNSFLLDSNNFNFSQNKNIFWISNSKSDKLFLMNGKKLYEVFFDENSKAKFKLNLINDNVLSYNFLENRDDFIFSYLVDKRDYGLLFFINKKNLSQYIGRIPITDNIFITQTRNFLATINSSFAQNESLINLIDIYSKGIVATEWINAKANFLVSDKKSNNFFALINENNDYKLTKIEAPNINITKAVNLPKNLYEPMKMIANDSLIYVFFKNAIVVYDFDFNEVMLDFFDFNNYLDENFDLIFEQSNLILTSATGSLILKINKNHFWFINRQILNSYKYVVPLIFGVIILILFRSYRNQKKLLNAILDLQSSGFVFFVNRTGKLIKTNEIGKQILGISDNIPFRKQFRYYCKSEQLKQLTNLIENGLTNRLSFQQKINIIQENNLTEWFCSLIPLKNLTGRFKGLILTGIDITEELERQTLTNWAQLAHDMQTNLSTIRLNAEQIATYSKDDEKRKDKIIHQVTILIQRVRDIVIVGRDDKLKNSTINSIDFCNEIRSEFDDNLFSNIRFEMNLSDFNFVCDKPKLIRGIRNAVENGIKSIKDKKGTITISCSKDIHNVAISVKDTGGGMDENTKKLILTPFYSTARKEGGSGIGTMIMQRVAELHGGKLIINSQIGAGTEIIFLLPDISRKK